MSLFELLILALGLSMDAFAVSICKGLSLGKISIKHMCLAGVWFGGAQALMPVAGYYLGSTFAEKITSFDHWIAFALLCFIGANMIKESFGKTEEANPDMSAKSMFILAVATSIDALAVGVTFSFLSVRIFPAAGIIGTVTFVCSAVGIQIGSLFGAKYKAGAERCGGILLIALAFKILLDGLGF